MKQAEEKWALCKELNNLYEVSNCGNIRSLDRIIECKDGHIRHYRSRLLKPIDKGNGYYVVNVLGRLWYIHRLVASAFIPNPFGLGEVNHKDENPSNNFAYNLEWCTHKYNANYGTSRQRMIEKRHSNKTYGEKEVLMISTGGDIIGLFKSIHEASKVTGIAAPSISDCCRGYRRKTAGGYKWIFKKVYDYRNSTAKGQEAS